MVINPSAHPAIPRMNSFQQRSRHMGQRRTLCIPGGRQLWFAVSKSLFGMVVLFFISSLWLGSSLQQVNEKIEQVSSQHHELVTSNIVLRAKKARLFSPGAVGLLADSQLAIHLPQSGQYRKL